MNIEVSSVDPNYLVSSASFNLLLLTLMQLLKRMSANYLEELKP